MQHFLEQHELHDFPPLATGQGARLGWGLRNLRPPWAQALFSACLLTAHMLHRQAEQTFGELEVWAVVLRGIEKRFMMMSSSSWPRRRGNSYWAGSISLVSLRPSMCAASLWAAHSLAARVPASYSEAGMAYPQFMLWAYNLVWRTGRSLRVWSVTCAPSPFWSQKGLDPSHPQSSQATCFT